jgi:enhancing lycopene biosynthesis protein 2
MMNTQPKALQLAELLDYRAGTVEDREETAAELRRLHSVNAELLEALDALVNGSGFAPAKNLEKARLAIAKAQEVL